MVLPCIDKRDVITVGDKIQLTTIQKTRSDFSIIELKFKQKKMNNVQIVLYCSVQESSIKYGYMDVLVNSSNKYM